MSAGYDLSTVDPLFVDRIRDGLINEEKSAMEEVFGITEVRRTSGKIGYEPSKQNVARTDSQTEVALSAKSNTADAALGNIEFAFTSKFAEKYEMHAMEADALADQTGEDMTRKLLRGAVIQVMGKMDIKGKNFLSETVFEGNTINDSRNAAAVWSDATNATPLTDLDAIMDAVGNPDVLWLGLDRARELGALPGIKQEFANYAGKDGRISLRALAEALLGHYPFLKRVVIDDVTWQNIADNQAPDGEYSRIFDGVVWAGKSDHMVIAEYVPLRKGRVWEDEETDTLYGESVRYLDYARGELKMGCLLAGT